MPTKKVKSARGAKGKQTPVIKKTAKKPLVKAGSKTKATQSLKSSAKPAFLKTTAKSSPKGASKNSAAQAVPSSKKTKGVKTNSPRMDNGSNTVSETAPQMRRASVQTAIDARKVNSGRKEQEKTELSNVVARVNAKTGPSIEESGAALDLQIEERTGPTRSERLKIDRVLADSGTPGPKKWQALHDHLRHLKAKSYEMTGVYQPKTTIHHKVLGWGYVLECRENRMDVLFRDGLKTLIMNYKP